MGLTTVGEINRKFKRIAAFIFSHYLITQFCLQTTQVVLVSNVTIDMQSHNTLYQMLLKYDLCK